MTAGTSYCASCGSSLESDSDFCTGCGAPKQKVNQAPPAASAPHAWMNDAPPAAPRVHVAAVVQPPQVQQLQYIHPAQGSAVLDNGLPQTARPRLFVLPSAREHRVFGFLLPSAAEWW